MTHEHPMTWTLLGLLIGAMGVYITHLTILIERVRRERKALYDYVMSERQGDVQ